MIGRNSAILAVVVTEGSFACAEVTAKGEPIPGRSGVFTWPEGARLEQADALGQALRAFLRAHKITATHATVGIPARWLIAQERELPPVSPGEALAVLRLQAEKLTASDAAELTFDFVGEPSSSAASRVLMIGTLRRRVDQLEKVMLAAGLRLRAVTPTVLALPALARGGADDALVMMVSGGGAELVWRREGAPRAIQHVPLSMNGHGRSMGMLGAEVRRAATLPAIGAGGGTASMLDAVGLTPDELSRLAASLGPGVRLQTTAAPGDAGDPRLAPALAVGAAAAESRLLVDFRHSRLAQKEAHRLGRRAWWAAAIAALLLLVAIVEVVDYRQDAAELVSLDAHLARIAPDVADAEAAIDRTGFGRSFYENRPAALACLTELTRAFGERDAVWATGVSFRQDGRGQLLGAGADQPSVLALLDRLKSNAAFWDVTLVDLRDSTTAREREVAFTITFTFRPPPGGEAPAGAGEAAP